MSANIQLVDTAEGGDVLFQDGELVTDEGIASCVYVALFGGNIDDDGRIDNPLSWWGNIGEQDEARQMRSETQHLLNILAPVSGNLTRIAEAVRRDLDPLVPSLFTKINEVRVALAAVNTVAISIDAVADGNDVALEFVENWEATL